MTQEDRIEIVKKILKLSAKEPAESIVEKIGARKIFNLRILSEYDCEKFCANGFFEGQGRINLGKAKVEELIKMKKDLWPVVYTALEKVRSEDPAGIFKVTDSDWATFTYNNFGYVWARNSNEAMQLSETLLSYLSQSEGEKKVRVQLIDLGGKKEAHKMNMEEINKLNELIDRCDQEIVSRKARLDRMIQVREAIVYSSVGQIEAIIEETEVV